MPAINTARSEASKLKWQNPEYRKRISEKVKATIRKKSPDELTRIGKFGAEATKKKWTDPIFRQNMSRTCSLETRIKLSESTKKNWSNQQYRETMRKSISEAAIESLNNPEKKIRENRSRISKSNWKNDEYRRLMLPLMPKIALKKWQNQSYREKMALVRLNQPKTSTQQYILYSLLDDLNIKYDKECAIGWYTFDCRIDPQLGINLQKSLLIEVQGDYWHSLEKTIKRDKSKSTYLKTYFPEYDLKYLWEHEFNNKDRIINLIKYWIDKEKLELINYDIYNINEKIISTNEAELFISKYHYAGRIGRSGVNLGYYLNDNLIAVIIYNYPMRQETAQKQGYNYKEILELSRLAIHPQYQIKNLASNIIGRSIRYIKINKSEIKCLVSFADATYNHSGTIYKASNWKMDGEVAPDYWYADDRGYICHKKTLWNKANGLKMTENEYCIKYQYSKIFGKEKFRYIYKLDKDK